MAVIYIYIYICDALIISNVKISDTKLYLNAIITYINKQGKMMARFKPLNRQ
jgi:hypothetical protein